MGWDGTDMNCYGMGWNRKIGPMDKPGIYINLWIHEFKNAQNLKAS